MFIFFPSLLLSLTLTMGLMAMDNPVSNIWDEDNYNFFYANGTGGPHRCLKGGNQVEYLRGGQWYPTKSLLQYDEKGKTYFFTYFSQTYYLTPAAPSKPYQSAGSGRLCEQYNKKYNERSNQGSYQRYNQQTSQQNRGHYQVYSQKAKGESLAEMRCNQRLKLQGKNDFSSEAIEKSIDNLIQYGCGELSYPRVLNSANTDIVLTMCENSEWFTLNIIVGDDESLNSVIDFSAKRKLKKFSIESNNANHNSLIKLAKFITENNTLEEVVLKIKNAGDWSLIIDKIAGNYPVLSRFHLNGPVNNADFELLIAAFDSSAKLDKSNKLEISNHNIETAWVNSVEKRFKSLLIQHVANPGSEPFLLVSKR